MLRYFPKLKENARDLRKHQTDTESILWSRLRRKQLLKIQFYRQKPIGKFIVDFYAPAARLVIEVDGSQHLQGDHLQQDTRRDKYLASLGLTVLRFLDNEIMKDMDAVLESIYKAIEEQKTKMFQDFQHPV